MILQEKEALNDRMYKIEKLKMLQQMYQEELRRLAREHHLGHAEEMKEEEKEEEKEGEREEEMDVEYEGEKPMGDRQE